MGGAASASAAPSPGKTLSKDDAIALAGDRWCDLYSFRFDTLAGEDGRIARDLLSVKHNVTSWSEVAVINHAAGAKSDAPDATEVRPSTEADVGGGGDSADLSRLVKAVLSVQRSYRTFRANIAVRQKAAWTIYQAIEYRTEKKGTSMGDFLTKLQKHLPKALEDEEEEVASRFDKKLKDGWPYNMPVEDEYTGVHLPSPLTLEAMLEVLDHFHKAMAATEEDEYSLLHTKYVLIILAEYLQVLKRKSGVNYISTVIPKCFTIVGDLHGQLRDLVEIFRINGAPSRDNPYLFNGDLVDRGEFSLEVAIMLIGLAVAEPHSVFINRGNHEDYMVCQHYGFIDEIFDKYGTSKKHGKAIVNMFAEVFKFLPVASVIDHEIFVIHGGISPRFSAYTLNNIPRYNYATLQGGPPELRPDNTAAKNEEWQILMDAVWSDPEGGDYVGWEDNPNRGAGIMFGADITSKWLDMHGARARAIARASQREYHDTAPVLPLGARACRLQSHDSVPRMRGRWIQDYASRSIDDTLLRIKLLRGGVEPGRVCALDSRSKARRAPVYDARRRPASDALAATSCRPDGARRDQPDPRCAARVPGGAQGGVRRVRPLRHGEGQREGLGRTAASCHTASAALDQAEGPLCRGQRGQRRLRRVRLVPQIGLGHVHRAARVCDPERFDLSESRRNGDPLPTHGRGQKWSAEPGGVSSRVHDHQRVFGRRRENLGR